MQKYRLPPTSDEYLRYTPEDLLVEYLEDYVSAHPEEPVRRRVHDQTGSPYFETGDPVIDRWERQIAEGGLPDLDEELSPEQRQAEATRQRAQAELGSFDGFEERFEP